LIEREVTEMRLIRRCCRCGAVTCGQAPPGISGPACYGPNLRAFATLPAAEGQISTEWTAKLIAGLVDIENGSQVERRDPGRSRRFRTHGGLHLFGRDYRHWRPACRRSLQRSAAYRQANA
jgi:hypothetical protein